MQKPARKFYVVCDLMSVMQALREHCSLSGHDPSKASKPSKQKQGVAPVQPAVPLELTVDPIPDQVEMDRCCAFPKPVTLLQ